MKKVFFSIAISSFLLLFFGFNTAYAQRERAVTITWFSQVKEYNPVIGQRYSFDIPPNGMANGWLWGTDVYTSDCSIASAAVHAGLINVKDGGRVTIEILPGQSSYTGTTRNGVTSYPWGPSATTSFVFVHTNHSHNTYSEPVAANDIIQGDWLMPASMYNNNIGSQYTFYFPPCDMVTSTIWGSGIYTTDCAVATAAVHAGLLSRQRGGTVTIEILPGQSSYKGSIRNGIQSHDWVSYPASFRFVQPYKYGRRGRR